MEEEKSADLGQSQRSSGSYEVVQWQWQSDLDSTKCVWQSYSDEECALLEQAFFQNKEVADLKDYEVDFKKMLQVRKGDKHLIQKVRRQEKSRFMMEVSKPLVIEDQNRISEAFGKRQQFLDYIMRRMPGAYGIWQRLKLLPLECKNTEFEDVIQEVVDCIEKAAQIREKISKARSLSQKQNFVSESEKVVETILNYSTTFEDFLKTILKVYTMDTFICYWLNEGLRNEDWETIDVLTPYLMCLTFTFTLSPFTIKHQKPHGFMNNLIGFAGKQKLSLYRGAALSKEDFELYNPEKVRYFSWQTFTSTSRDKNASLSFLRFSLKRAQELNDPKVGVLFLIEADFDSPEGCEGIIDTLQNSCSQYPAEEEVLLSPGILFRLLETRLIEKDFYEISLKVLQNSKNKNESIPLIDTIQDHSILKGKTIIDGLPSEGSFELLRLLRWNRRILEIEIRNSKIDELTMKKIRDTRITTKDQKDNVKLIDNNIIMRSLSPLVHYFSSESLSDIIARNKIQFQEGDVEVDEENKEWNRKLILKEGALKNLQKNGQFQEFWENVKQKSQATSLEVSMIHIQITNSEFRYFLESIKDLKYLENLSLALNSNLVRSTEDLSHFCNIIESLSALKRLSILLDLSDGRLKLFERALSSLTSLEHLSLDLEKCHQISDEGLDSLKTALKSLASLQSLSLNFTDCYKISDDGLGHLKSALVISTSLQYLTLNCSWCNELSNEGLDNLKTALLSLSSLKHLSLDFPRCDSISDAGLNHLQLGLAQLQSLQYLSLNLTRCFKISDEGLNHLSTAIGHLTSLQHLSLDFTKCDKISDEGIGYINMGLTALKALRHLSLNLHDCSRITDEGLDHLQAGLALLSSLQHLSLNFNECINLSNEGLHHLKTALISLTLLQHLSLDFTRCDKISDEGLNSLHLGLTSLKSLQYLSLNFGWCHGLSDISLNHLKTALTLLALLQYLSLDLTWCDKITNQGFRSLAGSLKSLVSVQYLSLNFSYCQKISDERLCHLKFILALLNDLRNLSLNFSGCGKITNQALDLLKDGLKSIPYFECHQ